MLRGRAFAAGWCLTSGADKTTIQTEFLKGVQTMLHRSIVKPNHMQIPWHDPIRDQKELPVSRAPLPIRAGVVGRVGLLLLSCGTGAWRVRSSMNELSEALGLVRGRHRAHIHRIHLLRRAGQLLPDADTHGDRRQHRQA